MPWILLAFAGLLEIAWAFFLKKSAGFTLPGPAAIAVVTMIASVVLLSVSMRTLPLGTAYSIWTGIGAAGSFVVGVIALGESLSLMRCVAAALIVAGIVLMKLASSH